MAELEYVAMCSAFHRRHSPDSKFEHCYGSSSVPSSASLKVCGSGMIISSQILQRVYLPCCHTSAFRYGSDRQMTSTFLGLVQANLTHSLQHHYPRQFCTSLDCERPSVPVDRRGMEELKFWISNLVPSQHQLTAHAHIDYYITTSTPRM
jgi:hypothetical protein